MFLSMSFMKVNYLKKKKRKKNFMKVSYRLEEFSP